VFLAGTDAEFGWSWSVGYFGNDLLRGQIQPCGSASTHKHGFSLHLSANTMVSDAFIDTLPFTDNLTATLRLANA